LVSKYWINADTTPVIADFTGKTTLEDRFFGNAFYLSDPAFMLLPPWQSDRLPLRADRRVTR